MLFVHNQCNTDLIIDFYIYAGNTQLCPYDGAVLTFDSTMLTCPPAEFICCQNTPILSFDSSTIPPSC